MVNDTTTLNGALSELGETMADNLFSMGVIDADASDGLTTLANKILNIEPSISGLDLDTSLTIHSSETSCLIGQSIMFWAELKADYDDETATDVDLSGVLTGATVTFKNGNTVLGTGVTDADGIAYYTHTFATDGTYNITASFAGTENFDDCVSSSITVSVTYEMTITADKPILSFADSDVATITATLSDGVAGVVGETLSYEVLDKDDNVLDSGSDVTDASGEISFSYQSGGIGDVQVVVYYGIFLQETYEVEDCWDISLSEITVGSGQTVSSIGMDTVHNVQNDDFILIFDHKGNGNLNIGATSQYSTPSTANYRLTLGTYANKHYLSVRTNSTDELSGSSADSNTYYTYKIEKQGTTVKFYIDDVLWQTKTATFFSNYDQWSIYNIKWGSGSDYMKNIRLKAL